MLTWLIRNRTTRPNKKRILLFALKGKNKERKGKLAGDSPLKGKEVASPLLLLSQAAICNISIIHVPETSASHLAGKKQQPSWRTRDTHLISGSVNKELTVKHAGISRRNHNSKRDFPFFEAAHSSLLPVDRLSLLKMLWLALNHFLSFMKTENRLLSWQGPWPMDTGPGAPETREAF